MAQSTTPLSNPIANAIVKETACNHVGNLNVRGGPSTVFEIDIDNTANAADTYVKFYDNAAPTIGTTDPDFILRVDGGERHVWNDLIGTDFNVALSFAAVTAGGTGGVTDPVSACIVRLLCT